MNLPNRLKPFLVMALLCCAAPLSVAADEPVTWLTKQKATEDVAQTTEPFTIVVLPDTQYYCDVRHKLSAKWGNGDLRRYFFKQTEWVRDNRERLNIAFLVHEGDIVQGDVPEEWAIAKEAMSILDGKVRYCMCLGNHDMGYQKADNKYGFNIAVNRTTLFNEYFPRSTFAKRREFGGTFHPDRHDNSWYHFEEAGLKFLIVALEYHPRDEVLDWANGIVAEHPDHRVITLTHSYLRGNKTRTTNKLKLKGNNGEQMWQKFVSKHKNMFMVLCGHFSGEAVLTSTGDHGNPVHQILSDYQEMNNGGESWLRYMVFKPDANKIGIYTYNPALDKFRNGPSSRFDLEYTMTQPSEPVPEITGPEAAHDVVVYGGTPGGITAAIAAARDGASVMLLEQTRHVGGLSTSGLNRDECNHLDRQTLGGLCEQFLEEAVKRSNGRWTEGNSRTWQSGIAERVFLEMLKKAGVEVRYEQLLDQVKKDGTRLTELRVQGGESYRAKVFIDATYEGDLMAKAGVSYAIGRESAEQYGESIAGVRYLDDKVAISPFDDDGNLLFGVMPGKPPEAGSASEVPICYNVRLNLTTEEANRVPIEKPNSYDPMQHELLARALEAGLLKNLTSIIGIYPMGDSDKRELNNRQFSIVSMSIPGAQTPWAEASFEEREAIHQKYRDYTHGMLWFLKTDPRVPEPIRDEMAPYGFCKDEWADNDHWPYYLYIRAARRMQGEIILTEADVIEDVDKEDVIHVGSHFIDCHHAARYVSDKGHIINEGRIWKVGARFDIPYRAITPKVGECSNLLVPVCASASHVAFCTIRLEPTWMHLGEAAGIAAAMAGKSGESVQTIDVKSLQARLLKLGIPLEHPEGPMAYEKKRGKPRTFAPDDVVKAFFAGADKDGDGMASQSEWDSARPKWEWLFVHIDKDKNGQLDRAEYKAFQDFKKANPDWRKTLESLGLRPGPNATVLLNGKPYRGIGINYFSCFLRTLKDGNDTSYDAGFATLAEKDIPFARFCATGFWPRDMKLYNEDREEYFRRLDGVVNAAGKHGIGLVPSLFWYYACVPDLVGEPMNQWANPDSKTIAWMRNYVREVVTRYRDNPTIWAWELGNEFSLYADIPHSVRPKTHRSLGTPESRSKNDELTFDMVRKAFNAFGSAVKKYDPNRLIVTGDSFPRLAAWHLERHKSWEHDSMDQFKQMLIKANPDPINGISLHAYEDDDQRFAAAMEVARKLNKPIFIGEFGAQHETDAQAAKCRRLIKAIVDDGIPLAALWVFDHPDQQDFNVTADNARSYQLDLIAEANRTLRKHADIDHSPVRITNPVKALADRVRGYVNRQPLRFPNQHWVRGTYYAGLMAMYESTSDRAYLDDCMNWGKQVSWRIKEQGGGPYESGAYPLICGQIWYGCYRAENDEKMMRPTLAFLEDPKVENPLSAPGKWYLENTGHRFVDGLFTAPPTLAMLYQMTGDEKYAKWMDACFWDVQEEIYDPDADLFYRDARSKPRKTKNGKKVLWSRGNGWAFGGLTRILKHLPDEHPSYPKYKSLYMEMAESLAKRQQADGFWRSNLDDPEQYAMRESSGTAFFCYGITWGINNGVLDRERFLPVARKAWTALASVVNEDGKVGWSQPAGGGPGKVAEADTSKFGVGIFLLAASEIYQLKLE